MRNRFINHWGPITQVKIPQAIVKDGTILGANSLALYIVLLQIRKNRLVKDHDLFANVTVGHERLIERTGYAKNAVTKAIKELRQKALIEPVVHRKKHGEFGCNEYILCNPQDGQPLAAKRDAVYGNGLPYFTFPECVVTEHTAKWSLAEMSSSELRLYTSILYLANRKRNNEFDATAGELRKVSNLGSATFRKALDQLECKGLVSATPRPKAYNIELCDPYTGQPLQELDGEDENNPANYFTKGDKGQSKRLNLNIGDPEEIERLVRSCVDEVVTQGNGDLTIHCPFHYDSTPSCSVSPKRNGCYHCFGCGQSGSLTTLLAQLKGITEGEAIQETATALGLKVEYHQPDQNALAIYSYRDEKMRLLKQVIRYPDENGHKVFRQRRPGKGGWIWNVSGLPPMLFNRESLDFADVVCITEGEKDAQSITALGLNEGWMIGTTSGGAESWDASLAKLLQGKRVVLMPDADEAGAKFEADVRASLEAERIEYRVVSFANVGQKDVSDFLGTGHTAGELAQRIGTDWVNVPTAQGPESGFRPSELDLSRLDIAI